MLVSVAQIAIQFSVAVTVLICAISALPQQGSETIETAAKKAYDEGVSELAAGDHTTAISLLKTAVRIQPENAAYHHKLAKAFLEAQKYHEMWIHLRKATVLDPGNSDYTNDFLRMWKYHDLQGTFNVGTTDAEVLRALGEPDQRIESDSIKRWGYGFMAIDYGTNEHTGKSGVFRVLDLRGYTKEAALEPEQVRVKTAPNVWEVAHHHVSRTSDNLELTLKGEKIQQWSELFSKQRFPLMTTSGSTVEGMVNSLRQALQSTDSNVEFNIVSESPSETLYHWIKKETKNNPAQHEVAKIIRGKKDFYRIAYVKKTDRLTEMELAKWINVIGEAKLVPTAPSVKTANKPINKSSKLQAFELGKSLSFAALIRGKHGPEDTVKSTLLVVSKNAQALGVRVPAPGKLTDDATADTADAIDFVLRTAGTPIYNSLKAKHGSEHAALFELATKSSLLIMLYQPGDTTSNAIVSAIERSAEKAKLPKELWLPISKSVKNKGDCESVGRQIKEMQSRIAELVSNS